MSMARKKNPHAVALGKRGAKKGGLARAAKLTPGERKEIAKRAAEARWKKAQAEAGTGQESREGRF